MFPVYNAWNVLYSYDICSIYTIYMQVSSSFALGCLLIFRPTIFLEIWGSQGRLAIKSLEVHVFHLSFYCLFTSNYSWLKLTDSDYYYKKKKEKHMKNVITFAWKLIEINLQCMSSISLYTIYKNIYIDTCIYKDSVSWKFNFDQDCLTYENYNYNISFT